MIARRGCWNAEATCPFSDFHVPLLKRGPRAEGDAARGSRRGSRRLLHSAQTPSGPRLRPRRPPCQHGRVRRGPARPACAWDDLDPCGTPSSRC
eukprot:bmy_08946T0